MANQEEAEYEKFQEKVRRTVYVDELTPLASKPVIESAFNQFGTVKDVIFIPNYLGPKDLPMSVLVEMETPEMAEAVIDTVDHFPFMVNGMPRPVRATAAKPEMFIDRPQQPGRRIQFRWVNPGDPDFEEAQKMKQLVLKHSAETAFMIKKQLEDAKKLSDRQSEIATTHHKKLEMVDKLLHDGAAHDLAGRYKMNSLRFR